MNPTSRPDEISNDLPRSAAIANSDDTSDSRGHVRWSIALIVHSFAASLCTIARWLLSAPSALIFYIFAFMAIAIVIGMVGNQANNTANEARVSRKRADGAANEARISRERADEAARFTSRIDAQQKQIADLVSYQKSMTLQWHVDAERGRYVQCTALRDTLRVIVGNWQSRAKIERDRKVALLDLHMADDLGAVNARARSCEGILIGGKSSR